MASSSPGFAMDNLFQLMEGEEGEEQVQNEAAVASEAVAAVTPASATGTRRWLGVAVVWTRDKVMRSIQAATRRFGGREMEEALIQVQDLLSVFFQGADESYSVDAFLSLVLLSIYYKAPSVTSGVFELNADVTRESCHYFRFAAAAYGWKLLNGIMFDDKEGTPYIVKGFMTGDEQNNMAVCEHTGVRREDILASKWTSSDFHPAHYLAVDHCTESVVLAIRGTFHLKDALTDMLGHSTPFLDGLAHSGMLKCARKKLEVVKSDIIAALRERYGYRLVIVGHSLGAGSATLIALMLKNEYPSLDVRCFAYAPPCVLDLRSAVLCQSFISSYILDTDVVPRLSYGSLDRLRVLTLKIMEKTDSNAQRIVQALAAGSLSKGLSDRISSWVDVEQELDVEELHREVTTLEDKLFPAGQVYHLMTAAASGREDLPCKEELFLMEVSNPSFFADIIISSTMFSNHMPNAYNKAFLGVERAGVLHRANLKAALAEMPPAPRAPSSRTKQARKRRSRAKRSQWPKLEGVRQLDPFYSSPPPPPTEPAPLPPLIDFGVPPPPSGVAPLPPASEGPLKLSTSDGEFVILHDTSEV